MIFSNKAKAFVTVGIFVLFYNAIALADKQDGFYTYTGSEMLRDCSAYFSFLPKKDETKELWMERTRKIDFTHKLYGVTCLSYVRGFLKGYLIGVWATHEVSSVEDVKDRRAREKLYCLPVLDEPQIVRIVFEHLKSNPDDLDESAFTLIYRALISIFPCG